MLRRGDRDPLRSRFPFDRACRSNLRSRDSLRRRAHTGIRLIHPMTHRMLRCPSRATRACSRARFRACRENASPIFAAARPAAGSRSRPGPASACRPRSCRRPTPRSSRGPGGGRRLRGLSQARHRPRTGSLRRRRYSREHARDVPLPRRQPASRGRGFPRCRS